MLIDGVDDYPEEVVEHFGYLLRRAVFGQLRGAHQVDVENRRLHHFARRPGALFEGAACDIGADMAAEQVPEAFPLFQAGHHAVEPRVCRRPIWERS